MAAFSRLQLAKALIEYDNENLPFDLHKNAEQSAVFMSLRRNLPSHVAAQSQARRSTDYLSVPLPSEGVDASSAGSRMSVARRSLASLRNPFGRDSTFEGALEDEVEVDLSSWGLDSLVGEDAKKKGKEVKRQVSDGKTILPNPHEPLQLQNTPGRRRPPANARTMSMGNIPLIGTGLQDQLDNFGVGGAFLDAKSSLPSTSALSSRRHSVGNPLDFAEVQITDPVLHRRRASGHALIDSIPVTPPLHAIPFPQDAGDFPDADVEEAGLAYDDEPESDSAAQDTFAIPPPPPERASRFDPKMLNTQRQRVVSTASLGTQMYSPSPDSGSPRPESVLSGRPPQPGRDRPYSRLELMRPKVLIMPSPLQQSVPTSTQPAQQAREGFEFTTDGPPLPAEARTFGRSNASLLSPSHTDDGFTPNPRATMTLSQLTFRSALMVDGQRDVAFKDIEDKLQWATQEGEQAPIDIHNDSTPGLPTMEITDADADADAPRGKRAPGKLYGKSLIDDLEARKAEMKGKQRVFTGDQRPSMMARTPMQRSSTLIDPESLKQRPKTLMHLDSSQSTPGIGPSGLSRRDSAHAKTLINFEEGIPGAPRGTFPAADSRGGGMSATRSVFGVDTIWERELAKLREIEAQEKAEEEERQKHGEVDDGKKTKGKGKRRGKGKEGEASGIDPSPSVLSPSTSQVQDSPNTAASPETPLSAQKRIARRAPPPPVDGEDDEEEDSDSSSVAGRPFGGPKTDGWHSGSDEERRPQEARLVGQPRRTTGSGPRFVDNLPPRFRALQQQQQLELGDDESSEEDLPLVATIGRAAQRATRTDFTGLQVRAEDSSDEERPLSQLLDKTKQRLPSPTQSRGTSLFAPIGNTLGDALKARGSGNGENGEDEDDKPLGLRASRLFPTSSQSQSAAGGGDEDDERPLALHPEQIRRSQFFASAAQQQQQQMMMTMQAQAAAAAQMQMQQSMMFGAPSIMSAPFYGPPMGPPMMMSPQLPSTPPPMHDTAKLNRVDKWRHDVAVEGER
ncbi:uncharacterized protein PHACADRAFT_181164 [Phanerochaete carnosa HHB-10118-sp]|uniref:Uncharacterized protein n=1 Tax=Phanerochaete carnosa (strain HHB-10118-sp) TaxID=650164 RepID=K5WIG5_PHACS|nr:uncharacterized protein PHACADRAFT_181164 [Phanerochaete carnosa HHB-10118-sp]EKM59170.1 hypothetical protein PHACADRAFT_181164 [Phanerochaete carnosa HHB-10118-sp]